MLQICNLISEFWHSDQTQHRQSYDLCLTLQLASAEEFEGEAFSGKLGEILIR